MPIPKTRADLLFQLRSSFAKLQAELDAAGPGIGSLPCVDDWSAKDLLAVRAWWTEHVVEWVEAGRRGEAPVTPAEGYSWRETPRLNADIVKAARRESFRSVRGRLQVAYERALELIAELSDAELLEAGAFRWAGNYPVARWLSINTVRQYTTARGFIRRTLRAQAARRSGLN